jgi:DNA-binding NarL/FixJ family response regulator
MDTNVTRLRIVLADDHEGFRRTLCSFLKMQEGIEVIGEAVDGEDVLVQTECKQPDLVLMDLEMPKRDGFEATREIKRRWPKTRVVVLSAHSSEVYRRAANEYLADGFIDKNSMKNALLAVLMDELARRDNETANAA